MRLCLIACVGERLMFAGAVNPTTGKLEWVEQDRDVNSEEADISRELARSQYGDMLYDKGRVLSELIF